MIFRRKFERQAPSRESKKIFIFCEGKRREYQYFTYFRQLDTRIDLQVYELAPHEDNSPTGLYTIAVSQLIVSEANPYPAYQFDPAMDEVWFVIDTDTWGPKIDELYALVSLHDRWSVVRSNPCFEVWLYFHLHPHALALGTATEWKQVLPVIIPGGFSFRKHAVLIGAANQHAESDFAAKQGQWLPGTTDVFRLGRLIWAFCGPKIQAFLAEEQGLILPDHASSVHDGAPHDRV